LRRWGNRFNKEKSSVVSWGGGKRNQEGCNFWGGSVWQPSKGRKGADEGQKRKDRPPNLTRLGKLGVHESVKHTKKREMRRWKGGVSYQEKRMTGPKWWKTYRKRHAERGGRPFVAVGRGNPHHISCKKEQEGETARKSGGRYASESRQVDHTSAKKRKAAESSPLDGEEDLPLLSIEGGFP